MEFVLVVVQYARKLILKILISNNNIWADALYQNRYDINNSKVTRHTTVSFSDCVLETMCLPVDALCNV